jgi:hypothetical protein
MKHIMDNSHYIIMFFIMIIAGVLSTMNIWVDKISDIRIGLNDLYMILLMAGWMLFFMGIIYKHLYAFLFGLILIIANLYCIRTQCFVSEHQYKLGMIPHHSMAVLMSKKLLRKPNNIQNFLKNLIITQEDEINFMKNNIENN